MGYELIITEKPNAAQKIAQALADGKAIKKNYQTIPYYEITNGGKDIIVACAVGHLYTLAEKNKKKWDYPIFDVEWKESSAVNKASKFTAKYVQALKKLAKTAQAFTVATDYDIEGEVIGYNVIRFICHKDDAQRMKYSTLTRDELRASYNNKSKTLDWGQAYAGVTRHELDWYWGINLSRALTMAVKQAGMFKLLTSGRVQGPALKIIVDREREINAFKSTPFWQIQLLGTLNHEALEAWHKEDKFWDKEKAQHVVDICKGKNGVVDSVSKNEYKQAPPTPFDLTTLQTETYRCHHIQPKETLELAQKLYLAGLISYPRTSSQKLPKELGYKKILTSLQKNEHYKELAGKVLAFPTLTPNEGKKEDPAHPAIYPTGEGAHVKGNEAKLYDLIVKRFLATFGQPALRETVEIVINVSNELFITKGSRTVDKGWHIFYEPYVKLEEVTVPKAQKGDTITVKDIVRHDKETQPPKRYTPASIIKELERRNLGTKATRSQIVDTLFGRGYVSGQPVQATGLGMHTVEVLEQHCSKILDEALTRHFEEEMDEIYRRTKKPEDVLTEAQATLTEILGNFKSHQKEIGEGLLGSYREWQLIENTVGKCPICTTGTLMIRKGKFGRFIACDNYPDCKTTFKLPMFGGVKVLGDLCEQCKHPKIMILRKGKMPSEVCINPECVSKHKDENTKEQLALHQKGELKKQCPKCGKDLVLRKSVYGMFLGCSGFPTCRQIEKL